MTTTICIFAKPPLPGKAKTRLIPVLGCEGAAEVAHALLKDVVSACTGIGQTHVVISATEPFATEDDLPLWIQPEGDLGLRIEKTMQRALCVSDRVIAVGADTPGLHKTVLAKAIRHLENTEGVLGPAQDGGFFLVGLRRCPDGLFENIRWSGRETLRDTLARFAHFGIKCTLMPEWFDLDTAQDLERTLALLKAGIPMGTNLARVLRTAGLDAKQGTQ